MENMRQNLASRLRSRWQARRQKKLQLQQAEQDRIALLQEVKECRSQLRRAEQAFDQVADPTLTESCVYQYRALQARYDALVLQARMAGVTAWAPPRTKQKAGRAQPAGQNRKERCAL